MVVLDVGEHARAQQVGRLERGVEAEPACGSYKVTKLQSYKVTKLQSYKVTKFTSCKVTSSARVGQRRVERAARPLAIPADGDAAVVAAQQRCLLQVTRLQVTSYSVTSYSVTSYKLQVTSRRPAALPRRREWRAPAVGSVACSLKLVACSL